MHLNIFGLRFLLSITASFCLFSILSARGQLISEACIKDTVNITIGQNQLSLPIGTKVQVLQQKNGEAIVSLTLRDGAPLITQIPISSLEFASSNHTTAINQSNLSAQSPPATSTSNALSTVSVQTTKTVTNTTAATNTALVSGQMQINTTNPNPSTIDTATFVSRLGTPLELTQSDFPEPDPNLKATFRTIDIPDHPEMAGRVSVVYMIALDKDGNPGPRAQHIVFYCPWYKEVNPLDEQVCKFLCGNLGLTVVSVNIKWHVTHKSPDTQETTEQDNGTDEPSVKEDPVASPDQSTQQADNLVNGSYYSQNLYAIIAFEAQALLETKYALKPEQLMVIGLSSGSDLAERMAIHYPDKISGVTLMGGGEYEQPSIMPGIPWLVMCTRGDANEVPNQDIVETLRKLGAKPLGIKTEPQWGRPNWVGRGSVIFHHVISDDGFSMCDAYIWDVIQQIEASASLKPQAWPYLAMQGISTSIYNNDSKLSEAMPDNCFTLPGKTSAYYWLKLQGPSLITKTSYKCSLWLIKPTQKAKGIIFYQNAFNYESLSNIIDDMYYFADNGYIVVYPRADSVDMSDLLAWIQADPQMQYLPLYAIVLKEKSPSWLRLLQGDFKGKFKSAAFINYTFDDSERNPAHLKDPETGCPTLFVFDSKLSGLSNENLQEMEEFERNPPPKDFNSTFMVLSHPNQNEDMIEQLAVNSIKTFFDASQ